MQKHAVIKGPPPTPEEVAEMLGLSASDVLRAQEWADRVFTKKAAPSPPSPKRKSRVHKSGKASGTKN